MIKKIILFLAYILALQPAPCFGMLYNSYYPAPTCNANSVINNPENNLDCSYRTYKPIPMHPTNHPSSHLAIMIRNVEEAMLLKKLKRTEEHTSYPFAIQGKQCNTTSLSKRSNTTAHFDVNQLPKRLPPLDTTQTKAPPSQQLTSPYSNYSTKSLCPYSLKLPAIKTVHENQQEHPSTLQANENDKILSSRHTSQIPGYNTLIRNLRQSHDPNYAKDAPDCDICPELIDNIQQQLSQEKENNPETVNQDNNLEALVKIAIDQEKIKQNWKFKDWQYKKNPRQKTNTNPYPMQRPKPKDDDLEESNNCPCPICPESFRSFNLLLDHLKTHDTNNHQCYECSRILSSRSAFCNHILNIHNRNSFLMCKKCKRTFKTLISYRRHKCIARWIQTARTTC